MTYYHVTRRSNLARVLKIGLKARTNPWFPHGRHVGLWLSIEDALEYRAYLERTCRAPCVVLQIDVPDDWDVRWDEDPGMTYVGYAYYIRKSVPPEQIKLLDK